MSLGIQKRKCLDDVVDRLNVEGIISLSKKSREESEVFCLGKPLTTRYIKKDYRRVLKGSLLKHVLHERLLRVEPTEVVTPNEKDPIRVKYRVFRRSKKSEGSSLACELCGRLAFKLFATPIESTSNSKRFSQLRRTQTDIMQICRMCRSERAGFTSPSKRSCKQQERPCFDQELLGITARRASTSWHFLRRDMVAQRVGLLNQPSSVASNCSQQACGGGGNSTIDASDGPGPGDILSVGSWEEDASDERGIVLNMTDSPRPESDVGVGRDGPRAADGGALSNTVPAVGGDGRLSGKGFSIVLNDIKFDSALSPRYASSVQETWQAPCAGGDAAAVQEGAVVKATLAVAEIRGVDQDVVPSTLVKECPKSVSVRPRLPCPSLVGSAFPLSRLDTGFSGLPARSSSEMNSTDLVRADDVVPAAEDPDTPFGAALSQVSEINMDLASTDPGLSSFASPMAPASPLRTTDSPAGTSARDDDALSVVIGFAGDSPSLGLGGGSSDCVGKYLQNLSESFHHDHPYIRQQELLGSKASEGCPLLDAACFCSTPEGLALPDVGSLPESNASCSTDRDWDNFHCGLEQKILLAGLEEEIEIVRQAWMDSDAVEEREADKFNDDIDEFMPCPAFRPLSPRSVADRATLRDLCAAFRSRRKEASYRGVCGLVTLVDRNGCASVDRNCSLYDRDGFSWQVTDLPKWLALSRDRPVQDDRSVFGLSSSCKKNLDQLMGGAMALVLPHNPDWDGWGCLKTASALTSAAAPLDSPGAIASYLEAGRAEARPADERVAGGDDDAAISSGSETDCKVEMDGCGQLAGGKANSDLKQSIDGGDVSSKAGKVQRGIVCPACRNLCLKSYSVVTFSQAPPALHKFFSDESQEVRFCRSCCPYMPPSEGKAWHMAQKKKRKKKSSSPWLGRRRRKGAKKKQMESASQPSGKKNGDSMLCERSATGDSLRPSSRNQEAGVKPSLPVATSASARASSTPMGCKVASVHAVGDKVGSLSGSADSRITAATKIPVANKKPVASGASLSLCRTVVSKATTSSAQMQKEPIAIPRVNSKQASTASTRPAKRALDGDPSRTKYVILQSSSGGQVFNASSNTMITSSSSQCIDLTADGGGCHGEQTSVRGVQRGIVINGRRFKIDREFKLNDLVKENEKAVAMTTSPDAAHKNLIAQLPSILKRTIGNRAGVPTKYKILNVIQTSSGAPVANSTLLSSSSASVVVSKIALNPASVVGGKMVVVSQAQPLAGCSQQKIGPLSSGFQGSPSPQKASSPLGGTAVSSSNAAKTAIQSGSPSVKSLSHQSRSTAHLQTAAAKCSPSPAHGNSGHSRTQMNTVSCVVVTASAPASNSEGLVTVSSSCNTRPSLSCGESMPPSPTSTSPLQASSLSRTVARAQSGASLSPTQSLALDRFAGQLSSPARAAPTSVSPSSKAQFTFRIGQASIFQGLNAAGITTAQSLAGSVVRTIGSSFVGSSHVDQLLKLRQIDATVALEQTASVSTVRTTSAVKSRCASAPVAVAVSKAVTVQQLSRSPIVSATKANGKGQATLTIRPVSLQSSTAKNCPAPARLSVGGHSLTPVGAIVPASVNACNSPPPTPANDEQPTAAAGIIHLQIVEDQLIRL